jgi:hypothetical protein
MQTFHVLKYFGYSIGPGISVSVVCRLGEGRPRNRGSISTKSKEYFISSKRPGGFWGPSATHLLPLNSHRVSFREHEAGGA